MLGYRLRQHIVEFKPGIGVVTDGAVDATSLNGPWSWTVPEGFLGPPRIDACHGGGGGAGGGAVTVGSTVQAGGGGSGASLGVFNYDLLAMYPGETWTVTCGAGGAAGAPGVNGGNPGATSMTAPNAPVGDITRSFAPASQYESATAGNSVTTGQSTGGSGGAWVYHGPGTGGTNGGGAGAASNYEANWGNIFLYSMSGGGGGSGVSGGSNGANDSWLRIWTYNASTSGGTASNTTYNGVSLGGGGMGAPSAFGNAGAGGAPWTNGPAGAASGYGAGGGGGMGGFSGSAGMPGMLRLTYWSMD